MASGSREVSGQVAWQGHSPSPRQIGSTVGYTTQVGGRGGRSTVVCPYEHWARTAVPTEGNVGLM